MSADPFSDEDIASMDEAIAHESEQRATALLAAPRDSFRMIADGLGGYLTPQAARDGRVMRGVENRRARHDALLSLMPSPNASRGRRQSAYPPAHAVSERNPYGIAPAYLRELGRMHERGLMTRAEIRDALNLPLPLKRRVARAAWFAVRWSVTYSARGAWWGACVAARAVVRAWRWYRERSM